MSASPDLCIISTIESSNNNIELTEICAVNLTDQKGSANVNANQDLKDSTTNKETENTQCF